ncbi:MAG: sodium/proline symporter, partial [Eggerthellaceae bacterium]|nr:sodium/proline symporter [Eggerthellaceae bacterium]
MIQSDILTILAMILYFVVVIVIGFVYAKRSNSSSEQYFLGGRGLGPWLTALSAEASDMSGWLLMGLPGVAYFTGASDAMWTAIGLAIGTYLNWKLIARRLRKYSEVANNSITVPDYFSNRYHDNRHILMTISAVIIIIFFSIYTGSCFVTCGKLFHTLFGWDYTAMMIFGAIVVFLYTFFGGYLSVCTTDLIQGTLMFFALATVFIGSVAQAGGVENTVAFLQSIPGFLSGTEIATPITDELGNQIMNGNEPMFGPAGQYGLITIISGLAWGLGYFGMPQVLIRFMSIRHSNEIKKSRIIAMVWLIVSLTSAVCIGMIGRAVIPTAFATESAAESVFIVLSQMLLPSFFCGLVVSGIFAAAMSSSSSYLLICGSAVAENIFKGLFKRDATDKQIMLFTSITHVCLLIVAI